MDHQNKKCRSHLADSLQIPGQVVGQLRVDCGVNGVGSGDDADGLAIRGRFCSDINTDRAGCPGTIVDHEVLSRLPGQSGGVYPGCDIRSAACGKWHYKTDRLGRQVCSCKNRKTGHKHRDAAKCGKFFLPERTSSFPNPLYDSSDTPVTSGKSMRLLKANVNFRCIETAGLRRLKCLVL